MKKRLHPMTKKAISKYAISLLKFYRQYRKDGECKTLARFYARSKANRLVNGSTYVEVAARQLGRYRFTL